MIRQTRILTKALDDWPRVTAATLHLSISLIIAAILATIIFALWYPGDYKNLAGGGQLFWIIVSVDVVIGPLLTCVVFNVTKGRKELWCDLTVIALLQIGALGYGMYTLFDARPVALVFEVDLFRVVSSANVLVTELPQARQEYRSLPLTGPWLLGTRAAANNSEQLKAIDMALHGVDVAQRPNFWQPYADSRAKALERSRPVSVLLAKYPSARSDIERRLKEHGLTTNTARFLPTTARAPGWVAFLGPDGAVAGFGQYDGFF